MTLDMAILIACAAIAICMRFFKPNLIIETFASTAMIVMLAFYTIARDLTEWTWSVGFCSQYL